MCTPASCLHAARFSSWALRGCILTPNTTPAMLTCASQEFYFAPRHASSALGELACTRCCLHIARRQPYWVDRAAPSWTQVRAQTAQNCGLVVRCVKQARCWAAVQGAACADA